MNKILRKDNKGLTKRQKEMCICGHIRALHVGIKQCGSCYAFMKDAAFIGNHLCNCTRFKLLRKRRFND